MSSPAKPSVLLSPPKVERFREKISIIIFVVVNVAIGFM